MAIVAKNHKCFRCGKKEPMFPLWVAMYGKICMDCMDKLERYNDQSFENRVRFAEMDRMADIDRGDA
jgi:NMD protein affecting ribosome stability and mRNA decay